MTLRLVPWESTIGSRTFGDKLLILFFDFTPLSTYPMAKHPGSLSLDISGLDGPMGVVSRADSMGRLRSYIERDVTVVISAR